MLYVHLLASQPQETWYAGMTDDLLRRVWEHKTKAIPDGGNVSRDLATYVDKILKGAKPADLPVEQPTKFRLVVNLRTAPTLGLTISSAIFAGGDEVIE